MVTIQASTEVSAPLDKVWGIVSDLDSEPQYWRGTKSVKNISKNNDIVEREVVIVFKDSVCKETVTLEPQKAIKITITDGPMRGTKTISLNPSGTKTRIDVVWDIRLAGFLGMFNGMVKKHIAEGTQQALERIGAAAEQITSP